MPYSQILQFLNSPIPKFPNPQFLKFPNSRIPKFPIPNSRLFSPLCHWDFPIFPVFPQIPIPIPPSGISATAGSWHPLLEFWDHFGNFPVFPTFSCPSDGAELLRREAETPKGAGDGENSDLGTPGAKAFLGWLWKNRDRQSFPALEGSEGLREFWEQEFLTWLLSGELCRPTAA
uniref:Uncharacterized protein n=1 Tax=Junco hyemalis TaxID=40217 RepID=A0A8C5IUF9_JUNHY